jgi:hypothetical protein
MNPISINKDIYKDLLNDIDFDKAFLLAPIIDNKYIDQSGQELHTLSDLHIITNIASDGSSDANEDIDSIQRIHINISHTRIPGTPHKYKTDLTINNPTMSSSTINIDPTKKVPKL